MNLGRVYVWTPHPGTSYGGRVTAAVVPLHRLDDPGDGPGRLRGRHVRVRNGAVVNQPDPLSGNPRAVALGDASPNQAGNYLFEPCEGGGRIDKVELANPDLRRAYVEAARFGEVNTYFHLDRIAVYINELLAELVAAELPRVTAIVNAHSAAVDIDGGRDGVCKGERWVPFQGGHYRLPSGRYDMPELSPIEETGEIHLGPGRSRLNNYGAMVQAAGGTYRANASHNAGILYHEYGHHITRHTADFRANTLRRPHRQNNRKCAIDEGCSDYFAAMMLETPHIWAWHCRSDDIVRHPRSLASTKTMADFDTGPESDPHANGTIWAAALWDLRERLSASGHDGARLVDRLVLKALLIVGQWPRDWRDAEIRAVRRVRENYSTGIAALLQADDLLTAGTYRKEILDCFSRRGISPPPNSVGFGHDVEQSAG
jgi:fungalysin metallopeptidase (M36)